MTQSRLGERSPGVHVVGKPLRGREEDCWANLLPKECQRQLWAEVVQQSLRSFIEG
jgi:hypothetical protein